MTARPPVKMTVRPRMCLPVARAKSPMMAANTAKSPSSARAAGWVRSPCARHSFYAAPIAWCTTASSTPLSSPSARPGANFFTWASARAATARSREKSCAPCWRAPPAIPSPSACTAATRSCSAGEAKRRWRCQPPASRRSTSPASPPPPRRRGLPASPSLTAARRALSASSPPTRRRASPIFLPSPKRRERSYF